jgi:hypothetical protein
MRTRFSRKLKQTASALLVVMVLGGILCLFIVYYLSLVEQQNTLSVRSQAWNMAIAVSEAGIEEGLEQINNNASNPAADGWSVNGPVYVITRTLGNGKSYIVTNDLSVDPFHPTITSRAFVAPTSLAQNQPLTFFADASVPTTPSATLTRAVQVRCGRGNMLIKGIVAKHSIDMNGNNILTDSFDSTDPNYNTLGHYPSKDSTKVKDNGDVATNDTFANSLGVGNANIYGHVITGPNGTVAVGSQGGVGEHSWQPSHSGQIETGYSTDNANFSFPDQTFPYATGPSPIGGTISVTNYSLATNAITSPYPPNLVPYGGVVTNVTYVTSTSWPNTQNTVTNPSSTLNKTKAYPAAGTYSGTP